MTNDFESSVLKKVIFACVGWLGLWTLIGLLTVPTITAWIYCIAGGVVLACSLIAAVGVLLGTALDWFEEKLS